MYYPLHEGLDVDKLFNIAAGALDAASAAGATKKDNYSYSSIAKAASNLIAVFPILASRTVSAETTQMVSKYIEQKSCQLMMLALQQMNISNAESGIEYLKKFHQNVDTGGSGATAAAYASIEDWVEALKAGRNYANESSMSLGMLDEMANDQDFSYLLENERYVEVSAKELNDLMKLMEANENLQVYDTQFNPVSINDYIVSESAGDYHVMIKPLREANNDFYKNQKQQNDFFNWSRNQRNAERDDREHAEDRERRQKYEDEDRAERKEDRAERKAREEEERLMKLKSGSNVSVLKDQEIKKMNNALPSLLVVTFYQSQNSAVATKFIIGVKAKVLGINTEEILRRIMNDNKDGQKFIKLMRTITGELKASELILGLSRISDDLKSTRKKGAYGDLWALLQNRARAAKAQVRSGKRNDFSAVTTVVISQADADELFREENFDITDPANARHFMNSYNLMSFIITDDATESLKILMDDGDKTFEELSYRMLEKDTEDGTYKKLINLMAASK